LKRLTVKQVLKDVKFPLSIIAFGMFFIWALVDMTMVDVWVIGACSFYITAQIIADYKSVPLKEITG
jgi:uncharacterized membrane protein YvlD (DUF360 family)